MTYRLPSGREPGRATKQELTRGPGPSVHGMIFTFRSYFEPLAQEGTQKKDTIRESEGGMVYNGMRRTGASSGRICRSSKSF